MPPLSFQLRWDEFKRAGRVTKNEVRTAVSRATKHQLLSLLRSSKTKLPEPPFPHLLQSNTPPTDLEATDILKAISTVEAQSLHLQALIHEHGPDRMVEHKLDRARQFVRAHKVILSVIRRIPPELLQEIFCQTVLPWEDWDSIPWALSQVCQRWRATALSMTILWRKLPTIHLHEKTPSSYVTQINELLVRSRDAPISFYLYSPLEEWESHPIIDALARHSNRWETVIINSTNLTIFAFKGVKGRLSSLRTLSLQTWSEIDPLPFVDLFEDAPQLSVVRLYGRFSGEIRLPFSQLTRFMGCNLRGREMVGRNITLATSLTTLEIGRFFDSTDIPVTTLPFLLILKVKFESYRRGFLDRLTLPVIQEMWIAGYGADLITDIIDIISRSHSPSTLKKFAFRGPGLIERRSGQLTRLLRLTPELVALNLPLPPLDDLANLIIDQNSPPLVPLLQKLTIETDAIRQPERGQILNAIAVSRCALQDSLTSAIPHLPGDRQVLTELRIIFRTPIIGHMELRYLEGWVPSKESKQLVTWKERLLRELPELEDRPAPQQREFDLIWPHRVSNIFSDLEKLHVKNVNDIYISEMHTILRRFTSQPVTSILSQFGDRAGEILEKWTSLFESHLKDRRWVMKGAYSLVYLSIDDALRLSPTGLDIVYGLKDNLHISEIFWKTHMFYFLTPP